jgi:hypothetical protein
MDAQKAERLLIIACRQLSGDNKEPFSLVELALVIDDNQLFYHIIRATNIQRVAYYRRAQFLSGAATIATLGLYLLLFRPPNPPQLLNSDSTELVRKPEILLPEEVSELSPGSDTQALNALVEKGLIELHGVDTGTVCYPTKKLWEVMI